MLKNSLASLMLLLLFSSCEQASFQKVKLENIAPVHIERLDQAVKNRSFEENKNQYAAAFEWYALQITPEEDAATLDKAWHKVLADSLFTFVQKEIDQIFPNLQSEEKQFAEAFAYLQHYFPAVPTPKIYSVNSGLNYGNQLADSLLFIGLDLYLGQYNPVTVYSAFPLYLRSVMNREYLVPDAMSNFIFEHFYEDPSENNFAAVITSLGKMMYLLDCALPKVPDHLKMKYTQEQFNWALSAQAETWEHILKNDLLYSEDMQRIHHWLRVGPFVSELGSESPDRLGIYTGWKMVRAYMQAHPQVSPAQLLQKDYKEIISYYKP